MIENTFNDRFQVYSVLMPCAPTETHLYHLDFLYKETEDRDEIQCFHSLLDSKLQGPDLNTLSIPLPCLTHTIFPNSALRYSS